VVEDAWSAEFAAHARAVIGLKVVSRARSLRALLRALARNEAVALVCDAVPPGAPGVRVCFAGQHACFPAGPARLAIRSGAPILPAAVLALPDGRIEACGAGLVYPRGGAATDEHVRELTQELAGYFERLIRRHPEQWYAFRPLDCAAHAA
jgi:KDO2-lipid IV(A) lauroyltransferase